MSTCHALVDLIDGISQSLDVKKYAVGVFIDLKKHSTWLVTNYYVKKFNFLVSTELHISG